MKRYRKKAKLAMIAALAISSLSSGINHVFAQKENEVQENIIEKEEVVNEKQIDTLETKESSQDEEIATGDVAIDATNFPDEWFRGYIREQFDSNRDGVLSKEEAEKVTRIDRWLSLISSVEGIEHFPNLRELHCRGMSLTSVDISKNPKLESLNIVGCNIQSIDVSQNPALKNLHAYETPITSIDVSKNPELTHLLVSNTNITDIDVSNNPLLIQLDVFGTAITNLDVSNNPELLYLKCEVTQLQGLDVSKNTKLEALNCQNNLAWLHIGDNPNLTRLGKSDSTINLGEIDITFNIQERFPGIDLNKIMIIEGAEIDKTTGVVSRYDNGTPILYTYDCGIADGKEVTLNVTLNFTKVKRQSSITINDNLNKVYDGQPVAEPIDIVKTGTGDVTFEWFRQTEDGNWESLGNQAPVNVGNYGVKAHIAANADYEAADSGEPTPFEITKATSTVEILDNLNKTYDGKAIKEPTIKVEGTSETATISWFKKESDGVTRAITWIPLTSAPVNAGDYKAVVTVAENNNSLGSAVEQEFTIAKAETNVSIEGTLDKEYDGVEVKVPNIKVEGSSGATTIEWYKKDANGAWELLPNAPKEVGEYKIVVKVAEDENYLSGEVEQTFAISEKVEVPSTPEEGGDNTTAEEEKVEGSIEGVQTGDATQTSMWTMLAGLSMSMMYFFRRKKKDC